MNVARQSTQVLQNAGVSSVQVGRFSLIDIPASAVTLLAEMLGLTGAASRQAGSGAQDPLGAPPESPTSAPDERFVFVARAPQDVATSCWLRFGQPRERTLASWAHIVLFAERATRSLDRIVIEHAALLRDPVSELSRAFSGVDGISADELATLKPELVNCVKRGESFASDATDFVDSTPLEALCEDIHDALMHLASGAGDPIKDAETFDALFERFADFVAPGANKARTVDQDAASLETPVALPVVEAGLSSGAEQALRQELASTLSTLDGVYRSREWWLGTKLVPYLDRVPSSVRSIPRRGKQLVRNVVRGRPSEAAVEIPGVAPKVVDRQLEIFESACRYLGLNDKLGEGDGPSLLDYFAHYLVMAEAIRGSTYFDEEFYVKAAGINPSEIDPVYHYLLDGEVKGLLPSLRFDPAYYLERYPDLQVLPDGFLAHYVRYGIHEGRRALPLASEYEFPTLTGDPSKPVAVVVVHEASRSGAPILGWNIALNLRAKYRVVLISLKEGVLWNDFKENSDALVGPVPHVYHNELDSRAFGRAIVHQYAPAFAIVNSVESRMVTEGIVTSGVPVVALVHEFAAYTKPTGTLQRLYELATEIVFPAEVVRQSSLDAYPILRVRSSRVLPQGQSRVPPKPRKAGVVHVNEAEKVVASLRPKPREKSYLVVGMGFFDWRKGVDLFLSTATTVIKRYPDLDIRFVWVGHGYKVTDALDVSAYVSDQIIRSGVGDKFEIIDAVGDVDAVYKTADLLYLSSRLDPLPNVSIDAALQGLPIVCYAEASGMAEILLSTPETSRLVVPHLDLAEAATEIAALAHDRALSQSLGAAVKRVAKARFNMTRYVAELEQLALDSAPSPARAQLAAATLAANQAVDVSLFAGTPIQSNRRKAVIDRYAVTAGNLDYAKLPAPEAYSRRILPGFHPYTYAKSYPGYDLQKGGDPTAHFIGEGSPAGPWLHPVIQVDSRDPLAPPSDMGAPALRAMLHVHMHYMDDLDDLVSRVNAQTVPFDVVITTDGPAKVDRIKRAFRTAGRDIVCIAFENHGRDILPFVEMLRRFADNYDVVGHLHGKKSKDTLNVSADFGARWRAFLWDRLFDIEGTAAPRIFDAFSRDETLGLVFPEDPHLIGWEANLEFGKQAALALGIADALPETPEFPVGTMFWARTAALQPLLALPAAIVPAEPLPVDGSVLHALERLIPVIAASKGFHYATTVRNSSYR
ncbi:rhamnan synthesis F family protein [Alcaligenaceae bacterium B3P038]|nr:rhamnan synthesis F family protein [Alcaligenaceae bacterium B3P038]